MSTSKNRSYGLYESDYLLDTGKETVHQEKLEQVHRVKPFHPANKHESHFDSLACGRTKESSKSTSLHVYRINVYIWLGRC